MKIRGQEDEVSAIQTNYQWILVSFFLYKFNVFLDFPTRWHLTHTISKTVITSQGGCYLHCANEEIEIQG